MILVAPFNEFDLPCRLLHAGPPLPIGNGPRPDLALLLDGDDDVLEAAMRCVSAALILRLADRVRSSPRDRGGKLVLDFEH